MAVVGMILISHVYVTNIFSSVQQNFELRKNGPKRENTKCDEGGHQFSFAFVGSINKSAR